MKTKAWLIRVPGVALALLVLTGMCAGQNYWTRMYGGTKMDGANAIAPTPDGNFIIAGTMSALRFS